VASDGAMDVERAAEQDETRREWPRGQQREPHPGEGRGQQRMVRQRERLRAAESEVLAAYGIAATPVSLALRDPRLGTAPLVTRALRCGAGPPIVLLHGTSMTGVVWAPLVPHLPGRTLYLVELPGCGWSDPFDHSGGDLAAHQTAFVGSLLDALELEQAAVLGASMGGWYALRAAVELPTRLTAVVAVTAPALALPGATVPLPMAVSGTRVGRRLMSLAPAPSARTMRRMLAAIGGKGSVRDVPDAMFEALGAASSLGLPSAASMVRVQARWRSPMPGVQFTDEELAGCPVPTLFVWGDEDKVQPPAAGERAAGLLPAGRVEVLPGGHGLWFDVPERCGEAITAFLAEVDRSAA
jgi:pimeloyl-ACP methyl ester carboxylesterase